MHGRRAGSASADRPAKFSDSSIRGGHRTAARLIIELLDPGDSASSECGGAAARCLPAQGPGLLIATRGHVDE